MTDSRMLILTYDASDPAVDAESIKRLVKSVPGVVNWWHHIPGVFLVVTELTADAFSERIRAPFGQSMFLVMEVDPGESEGQLPSRAWSWIKKRETRRERAAAAG